MDVEELSKSQIVLLTLLMSFVTSIATGIVTVSLVNQAPPSVTRTINRVVERTVERVVPDISNQSASVITKEVTVVVKEEDLITESIANNAGRLVRMHTLAEGGATTTNSTSTSLGDFLGLGFFVSSDGTVLTDASLVSIGHHYALAFPGGSLIEANAATTTGGGTFAILMPVVKEGEKPITVTPIVTADPGTLKLGQTVIALGGKDRTNIAIGVIAGFTPPGEEELLIPGIIETTIDNARLSLGSPLVNMFGEVLGMRTKDGYVSLTGIVLGTALTKVTTDPPEDN